MVNYGYSKKKVLACKGIYSILKKTDKDGINPE